MKIALINPMGPKYQFDDANDHLPPLGLLYLAAVVRPRHEVCVLDGELLKETGPAILKRIPFEPDLVGIGGTTSQAGEACNLARRAREKFPRARIVAGGTHATILGEEYLRECEAFDAVVRGPGEAPFAMLADGHDPATVPQVISRQGDGFRENPAQGDLDLSALPPPARDLVNIHHYTGTSNNLFRQTVIMATRGCPFRCSFCSNAVWGRRWQPRPIESVVEELKVIADLGFAEAFFQDDTLNANPAWTLELFEAHPQGRSRAGVQGGFPRERRVGPGAAPRRGGGVRRPGDFLRRRERQRRGARGRRQEPAARGHPPRHTADEGARHRHALRVHHRPAGRDGRDGPGYHRIRQGTQSRHGRLFHRHALPGNGTPGTGGRRASADVGQV